MQEKKLKENEDLWFTCSKCGTQYNEYCEEIIPPEKIKGSIEWAYSPTSHKNRWDALTKLTIREAYENKKRKSQGEESTESSKE